MEFGDRDVYFVVIKVVCGVFVEYVSSLDCLV